MTQRIERLVNLIAALLETARPMTAEQIREQVAGYGDEPTEDAFRRGFERDKVTLRWLGIPIDTVVTDPLAPQPDGYIIKKSRYYLPELNLEADELAALRIAAAAVLGSGEEAERGWLKLALDERMGPIAAPRVVWGADLAAEQPVLAPIFEAVVEHRVLEFVYESADGARQRRTVDPYGLVHRRGHWYLVGRDHDRDAVRSFKLARFSSDATMLPGEYSVPPSFDIDSHTALEAWELGESGATAVVRFDAELRWWAEQNLSATRSREAPAGALDVELPEANIDRLISWALEFGPAVEILEPEEARARLLDHLTPYLARNDG
ncbi:MAG: helix-turn-helix transcriptional regulator [Actinomycetota bacterium]